MKVAYIFNSPHASTYKLGQMILPQLEAGTHGVMLLECFSLMTTHMFCVKVTQ